jgi:hypothetical protein
MSIVDSFMDFDRPFSQDELCKRGLSHAFIALARELGCPSDVQGKLSLFSILVWLGENWARFRVAAALPALPPIATADIDEQAHLTFVRAWRTLEEYHGARTSDSDRKKEAAKLKMALAFYEQLLHVMREERGDSQSSDAQ